MIQAVFIFFRKGVRTMYFVPKNVNARFEILPGFGLKELILCGSTLAIGGGLALIAGALVLPASIRLALVVVPTGVMFFITQPGLNGVCLFDLLGYYRAWSFRKKIYLNYYEGGGEDFKSIIK